MTDCIKKRLYQKQKYFFSLYLLLFFGMLFFSCKSVSKSAGLSHAVKTERPSETAALRPVGEGTALALPGQRELAEKRLDARLISNVEKGSPDSLKAAMLFIHTDSKGLTAQNKLYLRVIADMMYLVYPLETDGLRPQDSQEENEYLTGLKNVKNGVYPFTMKKNDFLSLIIPVLILTRGTVVQNAYFQDMEERLLQAKRLRPESVLPYYLEGLLKERLNNELSAEELYKKAWGLDHSCYPAGIRYGMIAAGKGQGDAAIKIADILSSAHKGKFEILLLYAHGYLANKEPAKASEYIIDVLKREPENISALLLRIQALIEQGEYLKANALLDAYSLKSRTSKDYLLFRARLASEWNKNLISSAEFLSEAYRLYPEDFRVLLACAEICFASSQKIENKTADFFIQKALQKDPDNAAAAALLIKNNIAVENWSGAVSLAVKLANKYPTNANKELLVLAYLGAGNFQEALAVSKQLYAAAKPASNTVVKLYLEALYKTKNYETVSRRIRDKSASADSELKSILHYFSAKLVQGNPESYLASLRASLLANPRNKEALFAMYELYLSAKDYRKAKYYLGQVLALDPSNRKNAVLAEKLEKLLVN